jgi:hypothetical protein
MASSAGLNDVLESGGTVTRQALTGLAKPLS